MGLSRSNNSARLQLFSLTRVLAALCSPSEEVKARLGAAESDSTLGSQKLRELEMRVASLEGNVLAHEPIADTGQNHKKESIARDDSQVTESKEDPAHVHELPCNQIPEATALNASETPGQQSSVSNRPNRNPLSATQVTPQATPQVSPQVTGIVATPAKEKVVDANEPSNEQVQPLQQHAGRTCEDARATLPLQSPQAVAETEVANCVKSIDKLQKHVSSLDKHYVGIFAEMRSVQEKVHQLQAHVQSLSEKHGVTRDNLSKLQQQLSEGFVKSLERDSAAQQRMLELEGSQKQALAAASESQKAAVTLTRRVAAVETTHMNAERAATVAAAETQELWKRIAMLDLEDSGPTEFSQLGSRVRNRSIDSALGSARHDSSLGLLHSPSAARSPDVRPRSGTQRSFLNWPWRP